MKKELVLPSDEQIEILIICSMLVRKSAFEEGLIELEVDDFLNLTNRAIFRALKVLGEKNLEVTIENIIENLDEREERLVNEEVLNQYIHTIRCGHNFRNEIPYLKELTALRRMLYASQDLMYQCTEAGSDPYELACDFMKKISMFMGNKKCPVLTGKEVMDKFHEGKSIEQHAEWKVQRRKEGKNPFIGISSGYFKLDKMLGYFRPGKVYYIGARTSMGKTTFILNLIFNMVRNPINARIGFFTLEMTNQQIMEKIACMMAGINYEKYDDGELNDEELARFCEACKIARKNMLFLSDPNTINIQQIRLEALKMVHQNKIDILYIDYLTRVKPVGKHFNKHLEVDELSKALQSLAKEINIPIIILAQLNRAAANGEPPGLNSFRESGSIEEDADVCLLLHRPEYYDKKTKPGLLEVIVAKNRIRGKTGTVEYSWRPGGIYHEEVDLSEQMKNLMEETQNEPFKHFLPDGH